MILTKSELGEGDQNMRTGCPSLYSGIAQLDLGDAIESRKSCVASFAVDVCVPNETDQSVAKVQADGYVNIDPRVESSTR